MRPLVTAEEMRSVEAAFVDSGGDLDWLMRQAGMQVAARLPGDRERWSWPGRETTAATPSLPPASSASAATVSRSTPTGGRVTSAGRHLR